MLVVFLSYWVSELYIVAVASLFTGFLCILQKTGDYFFIVSKLGTSHLVMDVDWFSTTPGTQVISYPKKTPPADNQLWMKEDAGENTFFLVSKLGSSCKITIQVYNIYMCVCVYTKDSQNMSTGCMRVSSYVGMLQVRVLALGWHDSPPIVS